MGKNKNNSVVRDPQDLREMNLRMLVALPIALCDCNHNMGLAIPKCKFSNRWGCNPSCITKFLFADKEKSIYDMKTVHCMQFG